MDQPADLTEFQKRFTLLDASSRFYRPIVEAAQKVNGADGEEEGAEEGGAGVGGSILIAVSQDPNFNLCATLATPSGRVYRYTPALLEDDVEFWHFAARHYFWITLRVELRKTLAKKLLGGDNTIKGRAVDRTTLASPLIEHEGALALMFPVRRVHHF